MESQSVTYQAATEICDVLPFLLPAHTAKAMDRTLKLLLDKAKAGNDVEIEVLDLLNEHEHTREWLQDRLSGQNASRTERGFSSLPGDSTTSIPGIKLYRCPVDGCIEKWFMYRAGQKVPPCSNHQVSFVEVNVLAGKSLDTIPAQRTPPPNYRVLLLAANPSNTDSLRLQAEFRDIIESLKLSLDREGVQIQPCLATRPKDLRRAMLDYNPHIVNFSGHASDKGICLEDDNGQAKLIGNKALANLFALFTEQILCVVLNACYSSSQATEIAKHIPYVIGMKDSVTDKAARTFSLGFYDALFRGRSIKDAFHMGCNALELEGIPEHELPILLQNLQQ